MPQHKVQTRIGEMPKFCRGLLEESSASRRVEKKIVNFHHSASRTSAVSVDDDLAAVTVQFATDETFFGTSANAKFRD